MSVRVGDYNQPLHKRIHINSFEKPDELDPKENERAFACGRRPLFISYMKSQKPSMKSIREDYEYGSRYGNKLMNKRVRPIEEMRKADASYRKTDEMYKDYVSQVANRRNQVFDTFEQSYDDLPSEIGLQDKKLKEDIMMLDQMVKKLNLPKDVKAYLRNRNVGDILEPYLKGQVIIPQDENNQDLNPMMQLVQAITSQLNQSAPVAPPIVSQTSAIPQAPSSSNLIPAAPPLIKSEARSRDLLAEIQKGKKLTKREETTPIVKNEDPITAITSQIAQGVKLRKTPPKEEKKQEPKPFEEELKRALQVKEENKAFAKMEMPGLESASVPQVDVESMQLRMKYSKPIYQAPQLKSIFQKLYKEKTGQYKSHADIDRMGLSKKADLIDAIVLAEISAVKEPPTKTKQISRRKAVQRGK